jgi:hypothetical protein
MFPLPLVVTLRPSRLLIRVIIPLHLLAGCAIALSALAPAWQWAAIPALALSAWHCTRPQTPIRLKCGRDGKLARDGATGWREQVLLPPRVVLPGLILLRAHDPEANRDNTLLILPDSIDKETFRRLRVWLRWQAGGPSPQA